ncbi:MAG TPA: hypothetical protein VJM33_02130 [Microthrixaceae bacterium]|nr:hypothetical protein [Microthrixaceae bacterium]
MSTDSAGDSPLSLVARLVGLFEELDIPYALGGSLASSMFGEPRATADVDMAIRVDVELGEQLLDRVAVEFYVPLAAARTAIRTQQSFNLLDIEQGLKADLFVLGDGMIDQRQINRRVRVHLPGVPIDLWVTSPEDQVLRKLEWFRAGDHTSDRQWRDVLGLLTVRGDRLDLVDVRAAAEGLGLGELLEQALRQVAEPD